MKVLVQVQPSPSGEIAKVKVTTEGSEDKSWVEDAVLLSGGAPQVFDLEDNHRLVLEGKVEERVVMDRNQNAAIKAPVDDHDGSKTVAKNEAQRLRQGAKEEAARNAPQKSAEAKMAQVAKEALKPPPKAPYTPIPRVVPPNPVHQTGMLKPEEAKK